MSRACDAWTSPRWHPWPPLQISPGLEPSAGPTTASGRYLRRASGRQYASATWKQPLSPSCRSSPVTTPPRPKRPRQLCFRLTVMTHGCGGPGKRPLDPGFHPIGWKWRCKNSIGCAACQSLGRHKGTLAGFMDEDEEFLCWGDPGVVLSVSPGSLLGP